jgi:zinc protease
MLFVLLSCVGVNVETEVPVEAAPLITPVVIPVEDSQAVYFQATFRAGSAHDPDGFEGLAWVTAQLMREGGSGERSGEDLNVELYRLGTDIEVIVDKELVTFRGKTLVDELDAYMPLFAEVITQPTFDETAFYRVVDDARGYVTTGVMDSDEGLGDTAFDTIVNAGHPYGHPLQGTVPGLDAITLEHVKGYYQSTFTVENVTIGVSGAVDEALVGHYTEALLALPAGQPNWRTPAAAPVFDGRNLMVVEKATAITGVHFGHPIDVDRNHADFAALYLGTTALGQHRESFGRLFQDMRTRRGLNFGDYSYIEHYVEVGRGPTQELGTARLQNQFMVWVRPVDTADAPFATKMALSMVEDWVDHGLTPNEFETTRTHLTKRVSLWAQDPGRRLGFAVDSQALGTPNLLETMPDALAELEFTDVNAAIKRHIHPEQFQIVVVTGDGGAYADALLKKETTPMTYEGGAPDATQSREDEDFAAYKVDPESWSVKSANKVWD